MFVVSVCRVDMTTTSPTLLNRCLQLLMALQVRVNSQLIHTRVDLTQNTAYKVLQRRRRHLR